jgi:hypothetical protein
MQSRRLSIVTAVPLRANDDTTSADGAGCPGPGESPVGNESQIHRSLQRPLRAPGGYRLRYMVTCLGTMDPMTAFVDKAEGRTTSPQEFASRGPCRETLRSHVIPRQQHDHKSIAEWSGDSAIPAASLDYAAVGGDRSTGHGRSRNSRIGNFSCSPGSAGLGRLLRFARTDHGRFDIHL